MKSYIENTLGNYFYETKAQDNHSSIDKFGVGHIINNVEKASIDIDFRGLITTFYSACIKLGEMYGMEMFRIGVIHHTTECESPADVFAKVKNYLIFAEENGESFDYKNGYFRLGDEFDISFRFIYRHIESAFDSVDKYIQFNL